MYVWCVWECVQSSKSKEEGLPYKNFKRELGIPLISFTLSRPLVMMISIHSFSENTFFSAFSCLIEEPLSTLV